MRYDELVATGFQMIVCAGDARLCVQAALDAAMEDDMAAAEQKMAEARAAIEESHRLQTDAVQQEAAGDRPEYSMLFTHAQDTLMTINSEYHMAHKMIALYQSIMEKMERLRE